MTGLSDIRALDWERFAWTPGADAITELTEAVGWVDAVRLLDSTAQPAHRLSTVHSDLYDDESLAEFHRRRARA